MRIVLLTTLMGLAVILAIVIIRSARLASRQLKPSPYQPIAFNEEEAASHLARAIQFKTISHMDEALFERKEFMNLLDFLEGTFPKVHAHLEKERVGELSLLYTWKGSEPDLKPILLIAHTDVVPVESGTEEDWTHPPFGGLIADGFIWGRGALDLKVGVLGILEATEALLAEGFQPKRTVYLAFGHDEEVGGTNGAAKIATLLEARGVRLEYTLDEGLGITEGILPRVKDPVALIGIAEKGYLTLTLTVEAEKASEGLGHSSMPPAQTTIGILSSAIQRLEANPMPTRMTRPVRQMFDYIGHKMDTAGRIIAANFWLFEPLIMRLLAKKPSTNALIRTTAAVTMIKGGTKENVLPGEADAVVNLRLLPGDTIDGVVRKVKNIIDDPRVKVEVLDGIEPGPVSDTGSVGFMTIQKTLGQVFPGVAVAPSMTIGGTDSKHYVSLSDGIFRFIPLWLKREDLPRFHSIDERIAVDNYLDIVRFYAQLVRNSDQS